MNPFIVHTTLGLTQLIVALMLCHRALPRVRDARGQWHAMCIALLALALAISGPITLARAMVEAPIQWQLVLRDGIMVLYAVCRLRHALRLSDCTWSSAPRCSP